MDRFVIGALAVAAAFVYSPSNAVALVDNMAQPTRDVTTIDTRLWAAQSFMTDTDAHWLNGIDILAGRRVGDPVQYAALYSDGASGPNTLLSTFSIAIGSGSLAVTSLLPAVQVVLAPATAYWLVIGASGVGSLGWAYAEGNAYSGSGSFGAYGYSNDLGVSWNAFGTDNPYQMAVDVSAVPEPSTWALLATGLLALSFRRRWRVTASDRVGSQ